MDLSELRWHNNETEKWEATVRKIQADNTRELIAKNLKSEMWIYKRRRK